MSVEDQIRRIVDEEIEAATGIKPFMSQTLSEGRFWVELWENRDRAKDDARTVKNYLRGVRGVEVEGIGFGDFDHAYRTTIIHARLQEAA